MTAWQSLRPCRFRQRCAGAQPPPSSKHVIVPTITAAFETHPELDVAEVLNLCVPALTDELAREMRHARQQLIAEIRKRARL